MTKTVTRYTQPCVETQHFPKFKVLEVELFPDPNGKWVRYDDIKHLLADEWIACSDRLPEVVMSEPTFGDSAKVLVWIAPRKSPSGNMTEGSMDVMFIHHLDGQTCWHDGDDTYLDMDYVSHWAEPPEPPLRRGESP